MKVITIGRTPDNDIVYNDPLVSRHHAQLVQHDNGIVTISDMGSKNGTYINRQRITGEVRLNVGDRVKIVKYLLEWEKYFTVHVPLSPPQPVASVNWWWIGGGIAAAMAVILVVVGLLFLNYRATEKNIVFEGEYPPVKTISINEDGKEYEIEAVTGHILMFFNDATSYLDAKTMIERHGGKIIEQMPKVNYYLAEVPEGTENNFINKIKQEYAVEYVFLNAIYLPSSYFFIDDFFYDEDKKMNHGEEVRKTFEKYATTSVNSQRINEMDVCVNSDINIYNSVWEVFAPSSSLCSRIMGIMENADNSEPTFINMSMGVPFKKPGEPREILYKNVSRSRQKDYEYAYKKDLERLANCFDKVDKTGKTNYIFTKSSGNEGMYDLDKVLNKLDPKTTEILQKHLLLVNAVDTKTDMKYSNSMLSKKWLTTTVDISEDPHTGTSFAAPKLLGLIDKIWNENKNLDAQDIILAVTNATSNDPQKPINDKDLKNAATEIANVKKYEQPSINENTNTDSKQPETYNMKDVDADTTEITSPSGETTRYNNQSGYNNCIQHKIVVSGENENIELKNLCDFDLLIEGYCLNAIARHGGDNTMDFEIIVCAHSIEYIEGFIETEYKITKIEKATCGQKTNKGQKSTSNISIQGSETFTIEANGNQNYQDFYLRDGSLIQCSLYSFGLGDLTLKVTNFAPYPISVYWTLDARDINPKNGSGNLSAKGQSGNLRVWNDFKITGANCQFDGAKITVSKIK